MCRFLVFVGKSPILMANLLTRPKMSLLQQSMSSRMRLEGMNLNGDGFGVGWYTHDTEDCTTADDLVAGCSCKEQRMWQLKELAPCIFNSVAPAWNNTNLRRLAEKIRSQLIFAHVRAATLGSTTNESNCHPFQFGRFMWMHNGTVAEFGRMKKRLISLLDDQIFSTIQGTTDSEYCFALFLQNLFSEYSSPSCSSVASQANEYSSNGTEVLSSLRSSGPSGLMSSVASSPVKGQPKRSKDVPLEYAEYTVLQIKNAMDRTIKMLNDISSSIGITSASLMNFVVTDGIVVVASRYVNQPAHYAASLFYASGSSFGHDPETDTYRIFQHDKRQLCHIVTSEPLTEDVLDWVEVPVNHFVVISDSNLLLFPIDYYMDMRHITPALTPHPPTPFTPSISTLSPNTSSACVPTPIASLN